jgi:uncharacterized lipoprotein YmbA
VKSLFPAACALGLLCACASSRPDHFYILSTQPAGASDPRATSATPVTLKVTLPSLVDRAEIIVNTSTDGVAVLEHERWGAPLSDLVTQTLARDMERRRADVLVAGPVTDRSLGAAVKIVVDVVQMTMRPGDRATLDARWRIIDLRSGKTVTGGDVFSVPLGEDGYAGIPQALSDCLGQLADRLVGQIPA